MNQDPGLIFENLKPAATILSFVWRAAKIVLLLILLIILGALSNSIVRSDDARAIQGTIERVDTVTAEDGIKFTAIKLRGLNPRVYVYFANADDGRDAVLTEGACVAIIFGTDTVTREIEGEEVSFRSVRLIKKVVDNQASHTPGGPKSPPGVFYIYSRS